MKAKNRGWEAHQANQEFIEANLEARKKNEAPEWVWLEMIAGDGVRAEHTLELMRSECEHSETENGVCLDCGENTWAL